MRIYEQESYKKSVYKLKNEYKASMEKIEAYFRVCFYGSRQAEEQCINQILGEIISAQKCLKPMSMVVGSNLKEYCDKYIKFYQPANASILKFLKTTLIYVFFILLVMVIKTVRESSFSSIGNLPFGPLEAIIALYAIAWSGLRVAISKIAMKNNKRIKFLDMFTNVIFIILLLPVLELSNINVFVIKVPLILFLGIIAILVISIVMIGKNKNQQDLDSKE
ncbi:hypothetical protein JYG23_02135 [Sedimentibacter sp. zth1]|uniref:hypothetical protein n=1 Tax=Sedimentibacter sp. zth1 TaxID=2816908 RepID=UPI001A920EB1|nr:hypothetical protein [Sedimentibacter sp. zth1]QSX06281.1 hypothetical protein JYG23_02135 [Sedimentibacter sp. zth1]